MFVPLLPEYLEKAVDDAAVYLVDIDDASGFQISEELFEVDRGALEKLDGPIMQFLLTTWGYDERRSPFSRMSCSPQSTQYLLWTNRRLACASTLHFFAGMFLFTTSPHSEQKRTVTFEPR